MLILHSSCFLFLQEVSLLILISVVLFMSVKPRGNEMTRT